jgi:hypothetical protein
MLEIRGAVCCCGYNVDPLLRIPCQMSELQAYRIAPAPVSAQYDPVLQYWSFSKGGHGEKCWNVYMT